MRRIFVFGSSGMLGWITTHYLNSRGYSVIPVTRKDFDATSDSIDNFNDKHKLSEEDVLINTVAITNRFSDTLPKETFKAVNSDFPKMLDTLVQKTGSKLVHISTESVFKGDLGGYWESSKTDCDDIYGTSKLEGEKLNNAVVLRISPIGIEQDHFYNLISWVIKQNGKSINGFTNHMWNGITTLQFAKILEHFLETKFPEPGLYHIFSKRIVTKYELVELITKTFDLNIELKLHQTEKPVLRNLSTEKTLNKELKIADIEEQLQELKSYCQNFPKIK